MRFITRFLFCLCLLNVTFTGLAWGQTIIRVVGYPFAPYVNEDGKTGFTFDLLELLNKSQSEYRFELTIVAPEDRYKSIRSAQQDMILFEMPEWNWQDQMDNLEVSNSLIKDGEVYIAKRHPERTLSFFNDIKSKKIVAIAGYHYNFAEYNANKDWLQAHFEISFVTSQREVLNHIDLKKAQIGVVTLSYLKQYFRNNPERISRYLVSQNFAQVYRLKTLVRKNASITLSRFLDLLQGVKKDFDLLPLLERNDLTRQWEF